MTPPNGSPMQSSSINVPRSSLLARTQLLSLFRGVSTTSLKTLKSKLVFVASSSPSPLLHTRSRIISTTNPRTLQLTRNHAFLAHHHRAIDVRITCPRSTGTKSRHHHILTPLSVRPFEFALLFIVPSALPPPMTKFPSPTLWSSKTAQSWKKAVTLVFARAAISTSPSKASIYPRIYGEVTHWNLSMSHFRFPRLCS